MATLVGICGDPHYTSCTNPEKLFMKEVSVRLSWGGAWGMRWGESELNEFLRSHESRTV